MKLPTFFKRILCTVGNLLTPTSDNQSPSSQTNSNTQNVSVNQETTVSTPPTPNDLNAPQNGGIIIINDSNNQNCKNKQSPTLIVVTLIIAITIIIIVHISR